MAKNRIIEIRPFNTFSEGFGYGTIIRDGRSQYLPFFPDPLNTPGFNQRFLLDGRDENNIQFGHENDYKKILGGLLVDHQTFLITEIDENGNFIQHLCAFNLLQGALSLDPESRLGLYIPHETSYRLQGAPIVTSFDNNLYDNENPDNVISIMSAFRENNVLIGYQRFKDRQQELELWLDVCSRLYYINNAF